MKMCTRCNQEKEYSDFSKDKSRSDGYSYVCKECRKEISISRKQSTQAYMKEYYIRNKTKRSEYYENTKEYIKEYKKSYKATDKGKIAKRRDNAKRRRSKVNTPKQLLLTVNQWNFVLDLFSSCCACCGKSENITIDHIIPLSKGGLDTVFNVQPLCVNCNSSKSAKYIDYRSEYMVIEIETTFNNK